MAMLEISIEYAYRYGERKNHKMSYKISDRDEKGKMCIFLFIFDRNVGMVFRYCTFFIMRHTYSQNFYVWSYNEDVIDLTAVIKVTSHV